MARRLGDARLTLSPTLQTTVGLPEIPLMAANAIHFRCRHCLARMRAPIALGGVRGKCPKCKRILTVPRVLLNDAGPTMRLLERKDRFALAVAGGELSAGRH